MLDSAPPRFSLAANKKTKLVVATVVAWAATLAFGFVCLVGGSSKMSATSQRDRGQGGPSAARGNLIGPLGPSIHIFGC